MEKVKGFYLRLLGIIIQERDAWVSKSMFQRRWGRWTLPLSTHRVHLLPGSDSLVGKTLLENRVMLSTDVRSIHSKRPIVTHSWWPTQVSRCGVSFCPRCHHQRVKITKVWLLRQQLAQPHWERLFHCCFHHGFSFNFYTRDCLNRTKINKGWQNSSYWHSTSDSVLLCCKDNPIISYCLCAIQEGRDGENGERKRWGEEADNPDKGKENPTAITSAAFSSWSSQFWVSHTFEIKESNFPLFSSFYPRKGFHWAID